jgi:hypothetical protein
MESPLKKLLISCLLVNKHGCHRQFLLLIGRLKKIDWLAGSGDGLVFVLPIKLMQISVFFAD